MNLNDAFRIALTVVLLLALIFDTLFLIFSFRHKIGTRMCTLMLRSQTVIDSLLMIVNLVAIQYLTLLPPLPQTTPDIIWFLYCKLVNSEAIHWSLVSMSVYNLVCIAIERCCCLCTPFWYRRHKSMLLKLFIITVLASPFFVEFPFCWITNGFEKQQADNSSSVVKQCIKLLSVVDPVLMAAFGIAYVILFWALPSVLSVVLYLFIMRTIRRSSALHGTAGSEVGGGKVNEATRRLTLMTGVTSAAFVLLFAMDSVNLFLLCIGYPIEKAGFIDSLDSFLVNLNSAINPLMYLIFMPDFRRFFICCLVKKGNTRERSIPGSSGVSG